MLLFSTMFLDIAMFGILRPSSSRFIKKDAIIITMCNTFIETSSLERSAYYWIFRTGRPIQSRCRRDKIVYGSLQTFYS